MDELGRRQRVTEEPPGPADRLARWMLAAMLLVLALLTVLIIVSGEGDGPRPPVEPVAGIAVPGLS